MCFLALIAYAQAGFLLSKSLSLGGGGGGYGSGGYGGSYGGMYACKDV